MGTASAEAMQSEKVRGIDFQADQRRQVAKGMVQMRLEWSNQQVERPWGRNLLEDGGEG